MHSAGGAAFPELVREVFERLNMRFHNGYGATEGMTCITTAEDDIETICGTVGRRTCPGDTYKVVDLDGNTLPPNTQGELLLKGPSVFAGYYMNPEENAKVFDGDGFFKTGDLAVIDEQGYIRLTGRLKEMINRGGESISATVIESLINRHPDVAMVAVVPMPDPLMGERVCAYIQPVAGSQLTFEGVIAFLAGREGLGAAIARADRVRRGDALHGGAEAEQERPERRHSQEAGGRGCSPATGGRIGARCRQQRSDSTAGEARGPYWRRGCWPRPARPRGRTWRASPCTASNGGACRWWPSPASTTSPSGRRPRSTPPTAWW